MAIMNIDILHKDFKVCLVRFTKEIRKANQVARSHNLNVIALDNRRAPPNSYNLPLALS